MCRVVWRHHSADCSHGVDCYRSSEFNQIGPNVWLEFRFIVHRPHGWLARSKFVWVFEASRMPQMHQNSFWKHLTFWLGVFIDNTSRKSYQQRSLFSRRYKKEKKCECQSDTGWTSSSAGSVGGRTDHHTELRGDPGSLLNITRTEYRSCRVRLPSILSVFSVCNFLFSNRYWKFSPRVNIHRQPSKKDLMKNSPLLKKIPTFTVCIHFRIPYRQIRVA